MDINKISNETIFRILAVATLFLIFIFLVFQILTPIIWFLTAFIFTIVLNPIITWLAKKLPKNSRGLAIALVYILIFLIVGFLLISIIPILLVQSATFAKNFPDSYQKFLNSYPQLAGYLNKYFPQLATGGDSTSYITKLLDYLVSQSVKIFGSIAAGFTIFTVSIYMSLEGPRVVERFWSVFPKKSLTRWKENLIQMYNIVIKYILANLATAALAGIGAMAMLLIFGYPGVIFIGILVMFLDLIPMIGVWLIALILVGMGLVFGGITPAIIMGIYSLLYAQFEYSYLEPVIYGKATNISPLTIIIAVIIGGTLAGILGLFLAVPVAACIQLLIFDYLKYNKKIEIKF